MSEVKPAIKTAEERMQEWTAVTELDSFIQLSAAQFRDFLSQEVKELRAALEAEKLMTDVLRRQFMSKSHEFNLLQAENAEQAKRIDEIKEVMEQSSALDKYEIVERVNSTLAEKFCDSNCTWLDHHKDCKLSVQKGTE